MYILYCVNLQSKERIFLNRNYNMSQNNNFKDILFYDNSKNSEKSLTKDIIKNEIDKIKDIINKTKLEKKRLECQYKNRNNFKTKKIS